MAEIKTSHAVLMRPGSGNRSIVCLPAFLFEKLAAALPEDFSVYGFPSAVDGGTVSIEDMAEIFLAELSSIHGEAPCALLGYSFGGLIALEMATRLIQHQTPPGLLVFLDTGNPNFRLNLTPEQAEYVRSKYVQDRTLKYFGNLKRGRLDRVFLDVADLARKRLRRHLWKLLSAVTEFFRGKPPTTPQGVKVEEMWHAYVPKAYANRLLLIRAEGRDAEFGDDDSMGWKGIIKGGIDIEYSKGHHGILLEEPYLHDVARILRPYLERCAIDES